jgi:hypothetical protein
MSGRVAPSPKPIRKLSVPLAFVFAWLQLGEKFISPAFFGGLLITAGAVVIALWSDKGDGVNAPRQTRGELVRASLHRHRAKYSNSAYTIGIEWTAATMLIVLWADTSESALLPST